VASVTPAGRALVAMPPQLRAQVFPGPAGERLAGLLAVRYRDVPDLPAEVCDADVLVTSWGVPALTPARLDLLPALRLVAHIGASVKPFVTDEVFARGITVTQAGAGMARSVAEVALAFTLALLHRVPRFDRALRTGVPWHQAEQAPQRHEIGGSRIGVIGASRTGRAYLELVRALGGQVAVTDPFLTEADAARLGVLRCELDELLATTRIVAVHAPSLPETHHLLGARELALLPDGSGLVNTARSALVDEAALVAELRTGRIDAALDVYDDEPLPVDHPLRSLPNVLLTPHQAAATAEGRARQGGIVLDEIGRYLGGVPLQHTVGPDDLPRLG
jgi:phosphoglycerate dehydrogenase-like enzyme